MSLTTSARRPIPARTRGIVGAGSLYAVTTAVQRVLGIVLLPFFTRWLTPAEYGRIGFLAALAGFAAYVFPLGLEAVIMRGWFRADSQEDRRAFANEIQTILLIVPTALVIPIAGILSAIGAAPSVSFAAMVVTLGSSAAFVAATVVTYGVLRAERRAGIYTSLGVAYTVISAGARIILVGVAGLGVTGWLMADAVAAILLLVVAPRAGGVALRLRRISPAARAALRSGLPLVPHGLGHWALSLSDRFILVQTVPLAAVGVYSVGYQVGTVLIALFTEFNRAVAPEYAALSSTQSTEQPALRRLVAAQAGTVLMTGFAAAIVTPIVIRLILPASYSAAGEVVPWVVLGAVFLGLYQIPMNHLTLIRGETGRIWRATVTSMIVNVVLNLLTVSRFGMIAAAVNTAVAYGVLLFLVRRYECRRTGSPLRPDRVLMWTYAAALFVAALITAATLPFLTGISQLVVAVAIGGSAVCFALALYRRAERHQRDTFDRRGEESPAGARSTGGNPPNADSGDSTSSASHDAPVPFEMSGALKGPGHLSPAERGHAPTHVV